MTLSVEQKTNIRLFVFYLVNGTLDVELIEESFGVSYHDVLKLNPDLFYKTACVYINQEIKLFPNNTDTERLGKFICELYKSSNHKTDFADWETNFDTQQNDFSTDFKNFTKWFISAKTVLGVTYSDYIDNGASFVEQCFAIWANVVKIENNRVINNDHAIERVEQYIKLYFVPGYIDNLEEWERELYME